MGVALQVFFNLNVLPEKVEHVEATFLKNLKSKAIESLDGKKINASLLAEETSKHSQVQNKSQLPGRTNRAISAVASAANIAGKHLKKNDILTIKLNAYKPYIVGAWNENNSTI